MGNYYKNLTSGKYCTPVLEPCWQVCSLATRKIFFTKCWTYGYPGFLMVDSPFFIHTAKREKSPSMPSEKVYSFSWPVSKAPWRDLGSQYFRPKKTLWNYLVKSPLDLTFHVLIPGSNQVTAV